MDLLRVCKEVRGASGACRRTGPARQSAMGVAAVNAHDTACLHGFHSVWPDRGKSQWMIRSSHGVQAPDASGRDDRAGSVRFSHPDSAYRAGSIVAQRGKPSQSRHDSSIYGAPGRPEAWTPRANAQNMDVVVVSNRILPSQHCGVRAPRRKSTQRLEPARCGDFALQFLFLFPQGSRHLPFPFSNARVEVGRTVMEG
jgi:hypothetical protein